MNLEQILWEKMESPAAKKASRKYWLKIFSNPKKHAKEVDYLITEFEAQLTVDLVEITSQITHWKKYRLKNKLERDPELFADMLVTTEPSLPVRLHAPKKGKARSRRYKKR